MWISKNGSSRLIDKREKKERQLMKFVRESISKNWCANDLSVNATRNRTLGI